MFCRQCGKEVMDQAVVCPHCGCAVNGSPAMPEQNDTGSIGWLFLGLFVPLAGLILFLTWKDTKPLSAKRAGIGALIGVIASVVLGILWVVFFSFLFGSLIEEMAYTSSDYYFSYIRSFLFR